MTVPAELNNFCSSFESRTLRRVAQLQICPCRISPNLLRCKRSFMAHFDVRRDASILPQFEHKRTLRGDYRPVSTSGSILDAQADTVDLRAGKPSSFRVLASSCQYSPHAVNRSLR
jgi:hypothetical protein